MKKINIRSNKFKSLSSRGGKGASRGPSGTSRKVLKTPPSKIQGKVKY